MILPSDTEFPSQENSLHGHGHGHGHDPGVDEGKFNLVQSLHRKRISS